MSPDSNLNPILEEVTKTTEPALEKNSMEIIKQLLEETKNSINKALQNNFSIV
jgi:hypothetical protein